MSDWLERLAERAEAWYSRLIWSPAEQMWRFREKVIGGVLLAVILAWAVARALA